jgi:hypothetical protein
MMDRREFIQTGVAATLTTAIDLRAETGKKRPNVLSNH